MIVLGSPKGIEFCSIGSIQNIMVSSIKLDRIVVKLILVSDSIIAIALQKEGSDKYVGFLVEYGLASMKYEKEYKFKEMQLPKDMVALKDSVIAVCIHDISTEYQFPKTGKLAIFCKLQLVIFIQTDEPVFSLSLYSSQTLIASCLNTIRVYSIDYSPYCIKEKNKVQCLKSIPFLIDIKEDYLLVGDLYCSVTLYVLPNLEMLASSNITMKCNSIKIIDQSHYLVSDLDGTLHSFYKQGTDILCDGTYAMAGNLNVIEPGSLNIYKRTNEKGTYIFGTSLGELGVIILLSEQDFNKLRAVQVVVMKALDKEAIAPERFIDGDVISKYQYLKITLSQEQYSVVEKILKMY